MIYGNGKPYYAIRNYSAAGSVTTVLMDCSGAFYESRTFALPQTRAIASSHVLDEESPDSKEQPTGQAPAPVSQKARSGRESATENNYSGASR